MLIIRTIAMFVANALYIKSEKGVTAIEYGLIASLVALAIIVGAGALGVKLNDLFQYIADTLKGAPAPAPTT